MNIIQVSLPPPRTCTSITIQLVPYFIPGIVLPPLYIPCRNIAVPGPLGTPPEAAAFLSKDSCSVLPARLWEQVWITSVQDGIYWAAMLELVKTHSPTDITDSDSRTQGSLSALPSPTLFPLD